MNDTAIHVEKLGKRYRLGQREPYKALRDRITQVAHAPFRLLKSRLKKAPTIPNRNGEFIWALKDVSLEVKRGEVIGIIGPNGAGKTTLLKILSRITEPTEGYAEIRGRVGSLLEVATGFHPELTGRENVYLNGAILGMRKREIDRKFDEIVSFAEIDKFLDTPVKRYSSGMYVRLAFSVAAHLEPEILLVDEVLAVGDAEFQKKCLGKMQNVARGGRTVFFVSHNMGAVRNLCSRGLLIKEGRAHSSGTIEEVIQEYLRTTYDGELSTSLPGEQDNVAPGKVQVTGFQAKASSPDGGGGPPQTGVAAKFVIGYTTNQQERLPRLQVGLAIRDVLGSSVFYCSTLMSNSDFYSAPPQGQVTCKIDFLPLIPGKYWVDIRVYDIQAEASYVAYSGGFDVMEGGNIGFTIYKGTQWGSVVVPHQWALQSAEELRLAP